jgi:hypothetical protein
MMRLGRGGRWFCAGLAYVFDVPDCLCQEACDVVVEEPVGDAAAVAAAADEAEVAQYPQLVRDRRGLHADGRGEFVDACRTVRRETAEDANAAWRG